MRVDYFEIEESKVNKGCMCLIAVTEDGRKYTVSSDALVYLQPYGINWDTKENNPYSF